MGKWQYFVVTFLCFGLFCFSQSSFVVQNKRKTDKVRFKLINNIVLVPVEVNGITLSFLLDTGVSKPIIFDFLNVMDTLKIKDTEKIFLRGLGGGESIEALKSENNVIKIGDAVKFKQDLYAISNVKLNFTPKLGVPVHGIIGYDIFKDLVVEINYAHKYLKLTEPKAYQYKKCKKCETFNLEFYNNKPYINAKVSINNKTIPVKLLIDSGGSDALWLFEDDSLGIVSRDVYFEDFLGHGLSGSVYGKRSKIESFSLKQFTFNNANVAFPDTESISYAKQFKDRNGSISGNILKRFNIIMDYQRAIFTIKKNSNFKAKFDYNKSGIELEHHGTRLVRVLDNSTSVDKSSLARSSPTLGRNTVVLDPKFKISPKPSFVIVELRKDSPAKRAGLLVGDVILSINGKQVHQFSLQNIIQMFYGDEGKHIKLKVERGGKVLNYEFHLEDMFKQISPNKSLGLFDEL